MNVWKYIAIFNCVCAISVCFLGLRQYTTIKKLTKEINQLKLDKYQ